MTKEKIEECEKNGRKTVMTELVEKKGKVSGATAFDAMRLGDEAGKEVVDMYIGYLACGVANMMNIFQPEILCIGGGICGQGDNLLKPLSEIVFKEQYAKTAPNKTKLVIATLGNDAGIVGAAAL